MFGIIGNVESTPSPATAEPAAPPATPPLAEPAPAATETPSAEKPTPISEPEKTVPLKALEDERRKRQELEKQTAYLRGLADAAVKQQEPAQAPPVQEVPPTEPDIDQFPEDYDAYERAQRRYLVDLAKYELKQENIRAAEETRRAQTQDQIEATWSKSVRAAQDKYPDFMDVISNPEFRQSDGVALAIKASDIGGDLAYFLANNIDVANALNAMHPLQAAKEIGKIEAKILATPKPAPPQVISLAPEPISTVTGSGSGATTELKDLSMEEYFARRAPIIYKRR